MKRVEGKLFRNDLKAETGGRRTLRFTDVTDRAGVGWGAYGMGTAVGDYDNDGDLDLFLTSFGPDAMFRNNGDGTFTDVTDAGRGQRSIVEHQRGVPGLRPRRRPRSVRGELSRLHRRRQQDLLRLGRRPRLLQPACISARSGSSLSQRRQRTLLERHRTGRDEPGRRRRSRRERRRLQRRRLARSLRRQRRDPQSALDQPPRRDVRGRRRALGNCVQWLGQSRREHGNRVRRRRRRRRRGPVRHQPHRRDVRAVRERRQGELRGRPRARGAWRSRPPPSPASARTGSTSITTGGWICSSPTAPSTSWNPSADSRIRSA